MTELITINKKQYPLRMGYYALKHTSVEVKEKTGKELNMENMMEGGIEILEPLLFHSLVMGAKAEEKELDLKREDMEFVLDECMAAFMELMPKFFPTAPVKGEKKVKEVKIPPAKPKKK